jgi:two-component system OmpR family response regulator
VRAPLEWSDEKCTQEREKSGVAMKIRAYIVEDNAAIRDNLIDTLQEFGSIETVGVAETEEQGKVWLADKDAQWDLAIVDLFLKEGTGLGVVKACRHRHPGQKMLVLSNHATREIRRRCVQLGADAVFDKTTEIDALVQYCLAQYGKLGDAANHAKPLPNRSSLPGTSRESDFHEQLPR